MPANKLTDNVLRDAARLRFMELLTWDAIAKQLNCGESTLRKYNSEQEPRWKAAVEDVLAEMKRDALPTGYGCLLHAARYGDVSAAKELLNRAEGAVTQPISGPDGQPLSPPLLVGVMLADEKATELAAELTERIGLGAPDTGGPRDGTQPGPVAACSAPGAVEPQTP